MKRIRVALADDHALFRTGLRTLLSQLEGIEIVSEAQNGLEIVKQALELRPDVIVMDISMKLMNGIEATAEIRAKAPGIKIIMLSMHDAEEYVAQALRAGASGYLLKDSTEPEIEQAIAAVMRDEIYLTSRVSRHIVDAYLKSTDGDSSPYSVLTPRQRQLLKLIAEGLTTKDIAFRLDLSVKTVEAHRAQIMQRLGIRDVPGLVRYAVRNGLVSPER